MRSTPTSGRAMLAALAGLATCVGCTCGRGEGRSDGATATDAGAAGSDALATTDAGAVGTDAGTMSSLDAGPAVDYEATVLIGALDRIVITRAD